MKDLQEAAQAMRVCADAVQSSADALAHVHEMRAQAVELNAQADALEKQAQDALEATGCYRPASVQESATAVSVAAPASSTPAPMMAWDGSKFASV